MNVNRNRSIKFYQGLVGTVCAHACGGVIKLISVGVYSCDNIYIIFSVSVSITPSVSINATVGETYSFNCSLTETTDPVIYQWFKGPSVNRMTTVTGDASRTIISTSSDSQLRFSALKISDAELYTCQATVEGVEVEGSTPLRILREW